MTDNHIFLGVNFNKNLSWANQMLRIKSKLQANVGVISKIRFQITPEVAINLFQAMILSHFRYCNLTWCFGNFTLRTKLQTQSNKFLRNGFRLNRRASVQHIMEKYCLPSLNSLSFETLAVTMHKIILQEYPAQFQSFFLPTQQRYETSTSSLHPFNPTFHKYETTKQSVSHRACKTWNSLPEAIKYTRPQNGPDQNLVLKKINSFKALLPEFVKSMPQICPLF